MEKINSKNITVFKDPSDLAENAASKFIALAKEAISKNGRFGVALAGGSTPKKMYELLAGPMSKEIEWEKVYLFFGDERFVALDHPDSTFLMIKEVLLKNISIPETNIFPMATDFPIEVVAQKYSKSLLDYGGGQLPRLDLVLLGMGTDGHTASLFPNSSTLNSPEIVAVETSSPKPPAARITLTYKVINNAENIIVMVTGKDKAETLKKVLSEEKDLNRFPIQGIKPSSGKLLWFIDRDVASEI